MRGRKVAVHAAAVAVFATVIGWGTAGPALASTIEYGGRAKAVTATVSGVTTSRADTGELAASGGDLDAAEPSAGIPDTASADTLHASTIGQGSYVHSEASTGGIVIHGGISTISAEFAMSEAQAHGENGVVVRTGHSYVDGLLLNGLPLPVTGEPNQIIPVPGGQLVINEQTNSTSGGIQSITVNAMHLTVGEADVTVASSRSGVKPPPAAAACGAADFTTGGGWVRAAPNKKSTFGFVGGVRADLSMHGHIVFKNHALNERLVGQVNAYFIVDPNHRLMRGTGESGGQPTEFDLEVSDNAEPGSGNDTFTLRYTAQGGPRVETGTLGGGNVQIHTGC
jgi:hypothetical protein